MLVKFDTLTYVAHIDMSRQLIVVFFLKEKTQTLKDASHQGAPVGVPVGLQPIISELVELILRDFVLSWYQDLVQHEPQAFIDRAR